MGSKEDILTAIRRQQVPVQELPSLDQAWITYANPFEQFKMLLESVGGQCIAVDSLDEAQQLLASTPAFAEAKEIVSLVPGWPGATIDLNAIDDPHRLETVDFAIARGEFGVAENGAVWVSDAGVKHRALFFICQHLSLVVPYDQILNNMHEAYRRLAFPGRGFGVFISGPSKTADIEQSLVVGAHGARSLTVYCVR
jgi:L-lactate dehydrogenase complex protein LldG